MNKLNANMINPYIRRAMHSVLAANTKILSRAIFDYELIYIEKGSLVVKYDGNDFSFSKGDFILIRPGVPHSFKRIKSELHQPHIHFDMYYTKQSEHIPVSFKNLKTFTADDKRMLREDIFKEFPLTPKIVFSDKEQALRLFYGIIEQGSSPLKKKAYLTELIDMLIADNFEGCFENNKSEYSTIKSIKDYIDAGQGMNLCLNDLEKQFSYSKYYLEKQFKNTYGTSLIAYRNKKRFEAAKELLKTTSVTAVSEKLGFSSIYAFSRAYKLYYGVSPSNDK